MMRFLAVKVMILIIQNGSGVQHYDGGEGLDTLC